MNPATIRLLAAFGGGALVGSVAAALVTRHVVSKKWQAIADEQIQDVKDRFEELSVAPGRILTEEGLADLEKIALVEDEPVFEQGRGENFDYDVPKSDDELREIAERLQDAGYKTASEFVGVVQDEKLTLQQAVEGARELTKKTTVTVEESIFDKAVPEAPDGRPRNRQRPYVISILEFAQPEDDYFNYEVAEINWFTDNVMLDSAEEIMMDVEDVVGLDNLEFGRLSEDDDIVYVRNEQIGVTFEIHRQDIGYAESKGLHVDPNEEDTYKTRRRQHDEGPDS